MSKGLTREKKSAIILFNMRISTSTVTVVTLSLLRMSMSWWRVILFQLPFVLISSSQSHLVLPDEYSHFYHRGVANDYQTLLIQQMEDQQLIKQHMNDEYDSASDDDVILKARLLQNDVAFCYDACYVCTNYGPTWIFTGCQ
jgi:hypothetical protein